MAKVSGYDQHGSALQEKQAQIARWFHRYFDSHFNLFPRLLDVIP